MEKSRVAVRQIRGITVAVLTEEQIDRLDTRAVEEISEALLGLAPKEARARLLVDFSRVRFMGSSLLGTLIRLRKRALENQGSLKLCSLTPAIRKMFAAVKLDLILDIYRDEQGALDSFDESS